jgi:hypothetical protein
MSIINVLIKTKEIASLNESIDWSEWNKKLKNYLSIIDLWKILINDSFKLIDFDKHVSWSEKQKQLKELLNFILNISTRSLIERIADKNATQQYKILENEYNKIFISTFSQMYRRIFKCSLFNHKSIQKYDDEIINVRNKFIELRRFIDELTITCVFLNELDNSYQEWKDMWINNQEIYIKKNRKNLNVFKIEEILIKLVNRKTSQKFNSTSISKNDQSQKNKTFATKKRNKSFDNRRNKDDDDKDKKRKKYFNCNSLNHSTKNCWYVYSENTNDKFQVKYLTEKSRKLIKNEMKNAQKNKLKKMIKTTSKKEFYQCESFWRSKNRKMINDIWTQSRLFTWLTISDYTFYSI